MDSTNDSNTTIFVESQPYIRITMLYFPQSNPKTIWSTFQGSCNVLWPRYGKCVTAVWGDHGKINSRVRDCDCVNLMWWCLLCNYLGSPGIRHPRVSLHCSVPDIDQSELVLESFDQWEVSITWPDQYHICLSEAWINSFLFTYKKSTLKCAPISTNSWCEKKNQMFQFGKIN